LVFAIGRRSTGKIWVGLLAATLFSLSTYGIFYHRRILLDNIATFWLLLSIYLLVGPVTLRRVCLSGIAIGIAVLSKEIAVAAIPALAVLAARQSPRSSRPFAITAWLALALGICFIYPLMALLKGELFAAGTTLGGTHPHVSLLCSLQWQASRTSKGGFLRAAGGWAHEEPLLVIVGTAAAAASVIFLRRNRLVSMLGWTVLSIWIFLARSGYQLDFYLVPLLPLLALSIALVLHASAARVRALLPSRLGRVTSAGILAAAIAGCGLLVLVGYERSEKALWTAHPVDGGEQAVSWIRRHIPPSSRMLIDNFMWQDLHVPPSGAPKFPDAQYYWKAGEDPQIQRQGFHNSWRNVDYVISTPQLFADAQNSLPLVTPALEHSLLVKAFNSGGWSVEVRRVDPWAPDQFKLPHVRAQLPSCMTYS
jgi:hypothetical protein